MTDLVTESEEALLKMSVSQPESGAAVLPDFSSMTEEEQIAYAMQMSLAGGGEFSLIIKHISALTITYGHFHICWCVCLEKFLSPFL